MKINVFIANHHRKDGVEDIINFLQFAFESRGHQVSISDNLKEKSSNIIIDEFSNPIDNNYILNFRKKYPAAQITLVLTEFPSTSFFVSSFNNFSGIGEAAKISVTTCLIKIVRSDFGMIKLHEILIAIFYSPFFLMGFLIHCLVNIFNQPIKSYFADLMHLTYLKVRYIGLKKMINLANAVITIHPAILEKFKEESHLKIIGVLFPEINVERIKKKLIKNKVLGFNITGSITNYRKLWVYIINFFISANCVRFNKVQCKNFKQSDNELTKSAFSLHPPQAASWKYSSPTRLYRSIHNDFSIPVITKKFGQHPIEDIAILFSGIKTFFFLNEIFNNPNVLADYIKHNLSTYAKIAKSNNDAFVKEFVNYYS